MRTDFIENSWRSSADEQRIFANDVMSMWPKSGILRPYNLLNSLAFFAVHVSIPVGLHWLQLNV